MRSFKPFSAKATSRAVFPANNQLAVIMVGVPTTTTTKTKTAAKAPVKILHAEQLARVSWLIHGFSTRSGGASGLYGGSALNLGFTRDDARASVERNRMAFLRKLHAASGEQVWPMVTLRQVHSDLIHCVSAGPDQPLAGDGLLTATGGLLLAIQTADCLPVILVDTKRRAIGVFHAGWRGTVKRIVEKGVGEMRRCFGTRPCDIKAAIGPGIHSCCYEVGPEVVASFESQFSYAADLFREVKESDPIREKYPLLFLTARAPGHSELPRKIFLDLVEANRRQLMTTGISARNIEASELCSSCSTDLLFSYRAEKGTTGRMMAAVGIKPDA